MNEEIINAFIPYIPAIVSSVCSLLISTITLIIFLMNHRKQKLSKEFEDKYGEPLKFTETDFHNAGLSGVKIIAPKGKKILDLTECQFVKERTKE